MRLDLSDRIQLITFMLRDYSPSTTRYINSRLPQGGTFFDVGGHIGLITFTLAALRPDITIHSFEPNPGNVVGWRVNHALNPSGRVFLTEKGLSDRNGDIGFAVPTDSGSGMVYEHGDQAIPVVTLDTYCAENSVDHIDVLKLDVQGHEPAVLRGAERMLEEGRIGTISCEICEPLLAVAGEAASGIIDSLKARGFRVRPMSDAGLRGRLPLLAEGTQEDLVFEHA